MFLKRKISVLSILFILIAGSFLPIFHPFSVKADEVQGTTTFYFKNALQDGSDPLDFDSSGLISLSETHPTGNNVSYYPPNVFDFSNRDTEELTTWLSYWLIDYLLGSDEFSDLDGFEDIFSGFELLMPDPLRIVEAYEYTGNESIYIDGDINFDLFFLSHLPSRVNYNENDRVEVSIHTFDPTIGLTEEIASTNATITTTLLQNIDQQIIRIEDVNHSLSPGQSLLCAIELIPGNKTATNLIKIKNPVIKNIISTSLDFLQRIANNSGATRLNQLFYYIDLIENITAEANFTTEDLALILNSVISTSLTYDSIDYPSSVTVPFSTGPPDDNDNNPTYYLHADSSIDTQKPTGTEASTISLTDSSGVWRTERFSRNKIVEQASAFIYISHKDYQIFKDKMVLSASLKFDDEIIATDTKTLDRTGLTLSTPVKPYSFSFEIPEDNNEIFYDEQILVELSLQNGSGSSPDFLRSCTLYYDSEQYPSSVSIDLSETDHIQLTEKVNPENKKIIVNEEVIYTLNITSNLADNISINIKDNTFSAAENANWSIDIVPQQFTISGNGQKQVLITCKSTLNSLNAYENDPLMVTIEIIGKTGYLAHDISAEVSEEAVTYDFELIAPPDKEIIHGQKDSYLFIIRNNNTGLWPDGYNVDAISDHGFNLTIDPLSVRNIGSGNQTTINVTVIIPEDTEVEQDSILFIVRSKGSGLTKNVTVNTTIIGANIFEAIYDVFQGIAENMGLDDIFGDYSAHMLAALLFIIIFFILIIMVLVLTTKYVEVICLERIKEVHPGEKAVFEVTVVNPTKKMQSYDIQTAMSSNGGKWNISSSHKKAVIPPKNKKQMVITVTPTDEINHDDWTEITLTVAPENKKGCETITLMASLKNGEAKLDIDNVFHWPKSFDDKERVSTSFRLRNNGVLKAKQVSVSLQVNGKEKNKVEDIDIPPRGYADISIPWIAEKGKNEITITVS